MTRKTRKEAFVQHIKDLIDMTADAEIEFAGEGNEDWDRFAYGAAETIVMSLELMTQVEHPMEYTGK